MKTFIRTWAVFTVASVLCASAWADDEFGDSAEASLASAEGEVDAAGVGDDEAATEDTLGAATPKQKEKHFHILPFCRMLEGTAEVLLPGATAWVPIKEGKFYPLGTSYRTSGQQTQLVLKFGNEVAVEIKGEASFGTRMQDLSDPSRTIVLGSGMITVKLPRNFPDGLLVVTAPGFKAVNLKGDSSYTYTKSPEGDGDTAIVRCVTGEMTIEGSHFKVLSMKAANEIKIRTSLDRLYTGIYGLSGDCLVRLDQGCAFIKDYATGEARREEKTLDWKLYPSTVVRIHRAVPALGEKMAVTVMTFDATGELKNRCVFVENTAEINSGELGSTTSKKEREDIAKKAAEATDTVTVEAESEGASSTEATSGEASSASDSAASDDDDFDF